MTLVSYSGKQLQRMFRENYLAELLRILGEDDEDSIAMVEYLRSIRVLYYTLHLCEEDHGQVMKQVSKGKVKAKKKLTTHLIINNGETFCEGEVESC